ILVPGVTLLQLGRLLPQPLVAERLHLGLERVRGLDERAVALQKPLIPGAEDTREDVRDRVEQKEALGGRLVADYSNPGPWPGPAGLDGERRRTFRGAETGHRPARRSGCPAATLRVQPTESQLDSRSYPTASTRPFGRCRSAGRPGGRSAAPRSAGSGRSRGRCGPSAR